MKKFKEDLSSGNNRSFSRLLSISLKIKINRTLILPLVLYDCETWSLTQREGLRLRSFENRVLSKIFGPQREGGAAGWRRLHCEELHNLHTSPNIIRLSKSGGGGVGWARHIARTGAMRNEYKILLEKT
jgi:hypothetical protein